MSRIIRWSLLALFLIVVGIWPAAAAPVSLAGTGLAVVIAAIPAPALLAIAAAIAWLKHQSTPTATA